MKLQTITKSYAKGFQYRQVEQSVTKIELFNLIGVVPNKLHIQNQFYQSVRQPREFPRFVSTDNIFNTTKNNLTKDINKKKTVNYETIDRWKQKYQRINNRDERKKQHPTNQIKIQMQSYKDEAVPITEVLLPSLPLASSPQMSKQPMKSSSRKKIIINNKKTIQNCFPQMMVSHIQIIRNKGVSLRANKGDNQQEDNDIVKRSLSKFRLQKLKKKQRIENQDQHFQKVLKKVAEQGVPTRWDAQLYEEEF